MDKQTLINELKRRVEILEAESRKQEPDLLWVKAMDVSTAAQVFAETFCNHET